MTAEELAKKKQEDIDSLKNYKLPTEIADKVIHVRPDKIVFSYHFDRIDLRKETPGRILQLAKAKDCPYLQMKEEAPAKAKAATESDKAEGSAGSGGKGAK